MAPEVQDDRSDRGDPHPGEGQPAGFFSTATFGPAIATAEMTDR
jgi:hypothetical protein